MGFLADQGLVVVDRRSKHDNKPMIDGEQARAWQGVARHA
jgi:hypothetical protein